MKKTRSIALKVAAAYVVGVAACTSGEAAFTSGGEPASSPNSSATSASTSAGTGGLGGSGAASSSASAAGAGDVAASAGGAGGASASSSSAGGAGGAGGGMGCSAGTKLCNGFCIDVSSDDANCGDCDKKCSGGSSCLKGACTCQLYQKLCNGVCIPTSQDPNNCGDCGVKCPMGQTCSAGKCVAGCLPGLTACNQSCVDLKTDANNCGMCGKKCPQNQGCVEGSCQPAVIVDPAPAKCANGGPPIVLKWGNQEQCSGQQAQVTFTWALCSCNNILIGSSLLTDAYDSTKGPYTSPGLDGAGVGLHGTLTANGPVSISGSLWSASANGLSTTAKYGINQELHDGGKLSTNVLFNVGGDGYVVGDITANAATKFGNTLHQSVNATISGNVAFNKLVNENVDVPPPCACPPQKAIPVSAIVTARQPPNNDDALIKLDPDVFAKPGGPKHLDLPCGHYYLSQIQAGGGSVTITAHGHTALYVDGDVNAGYFALTLDPGATFDVFVKGNISTSGDMNIGSPNYPALMRTYIGGSLYPAGNTTVGGNIYTAFAPLTISSPLEVYGGLIVGSLSNAGAETMIHYDEAVLFAGSDCPPPPAKKPCKPSGGKCAADAECCNKACVNGTCGPSMCTPDGGKCSVPADCCGGLCTNGVCGPPPKDCGTCKDCGNQACINGKCGACGSSADCCPPLLCYMGQCVPIPK